MDEHAAQGAPGATAHVSSGHTADTHGGHGSGSYAEHGHEGMGLGPIDWTMWGAGLLGVAIGVIGAACFALSTGRLG